MHWRFAIPVCLLVELKGHKKERRLNDIRVTAHLMTIITNILFNMNIVGLSTHC